MQPDPQGCTECGSPHSSTEPHARSTDVEPVDQGDVTAPDNAPIPLVAGSFALYEDGKGGFWLVTHNPEQGVVKTHIPRKMVRIGMALAGSIAREDSLSGRRFGKKG